MSLTIHLHLERDGEGVLRASSRDCPTLAEFLEQDVQDSPAAVADWLARTEEVENGERGVWIASGNAFKVTLTPDEAVLESLFHASPQSARLPLVSFRQALSLWQAHNG